MSVDFSWTLTLPREQLSVLLVGRLTRAALLSLDIPASSIAATVDALEAAGSHLVRHSSADTYRLSLAIAGHSCSVEITDQPLVPYTSAASRTDQSDGAGPSGEALSQLLARTAHRVAVHHTRERGMLLSFQIPL